MDLKREIVITVNENNYKVKFPTVGQFIQIEAQKALLSRNQYGSMITSGTKVAFKALDFVDMLAYFTILIPEMNDKDADAYVNLHNLDIMDANELLKVYKEDFKPWVDAWVAIINKTDKKKDSKK